MNQRTAPECGCVTEGKIVRGMCATHYDRWVHRTPKDQRGDAPRFLRKFHDFVDSSGGPDSCWHWTGPVNRAGYGIYSNQVEGLRGLAHRISLRLSVAPAEESLMACHRCDNPPCVNPSHLYWGTALDNARDSVERQGGPHNKGVFASACRRGHEMVGENVRVVMVAGKGQKRVCRECDNKRSRDNQRKYRAERASR